MNPRYLPEDMMLGRETSVRGPKPSLALRLATERLTSTAALDVICDCLKYFV